MRDADVEGDSLGIKEHSHGVAGAGREHLWSTAGENGEGTDRFLDKDVQGHVVADHVGDEKVHLGA